jgi:hypothetical protein
MRGGCVRGGEWVWVEEERGSAHLNHGSREGGRGWCVCEGWGVTGVGVGGGAEGMGSPKPR